LVDSTHVRDLLFRAKDLFVAAIDMFGVVQFLEIAFRHFGIPKPRNACAFIGEQDSIARFRASLSLPPTSGGLLIRAKDLFVAARTAAWACGHSGAGRCVALRH
jgi:hypothetical protein